MIYITVSEAKRIVAALGDALIFVNGVLDGISIPHPQGEKKRLAGELEELREELIHLIGTSEDNEN